MTLIEIFVRESAPNLNEYVEPVHTIASIPLKSVKEFQDLIYRLRIRQAEIGYFLAPEDSNFKLFLGATIDFL